MSFRLDCYLIIPNTDRARVLLVQDDQHWALPHFAFTEDRFPEKADARQHLQDAYLEP